MQSVIDTILETILGTGYTEIHVIFTCFVIIGLIMMFKRK